MLGTSRVSVLSFAVALAVTVSCMPHEDRASRTRTIERVADLPQWAVHPEQERWKQTPLRTGDLRSEKASAALARVSHSFEPRPDGRLASFAQRYRVAVGSRTLELDDETSHVELAPARISWGQVRLDGAPLESISFGNTVQDALDASKDIVEHVEARSDGVEVSWLLRKRLASNADLEIAWGYRGPIVQAAEGKVSASSFSMGSVTVVDASGKRTPVAVETRHDEFLIRVPNVVLEAAVFPVVVDPLISPKYEVYAGGTGDARVLSPSISSLNEKAIIAWWQPRPDYSEAQSTRGDLNSVILERDSLTGTLSVSGEVRSILSNVETADANHVTTASTAEHYVIAWYNSRQARIDAVAIDAAGAVQAPGIRTLANQAANASFALSCSGTRCLVLWKTLAGTMRAALTDGDLRLASAADLGAAPSGTLQTSVASAPNSFAAIWTNTAGSNVTSGVMINANMIQDRVPFSVGTGTATATDVKVVHDGTNFVAGFIAASPDASLPGGFARRVTLRRVSPFGTVGALDIVCSGARSDAQSLAMASSSGVTAVVYTDSENLIRSCTIANGTTVTEGDVVDDVVFAATVKPQIVATSFTDPPRFYALWEFGGIAPGETTYNSDWAYDARVRDYHLDGAVLRATETVVGSGEGALHISHLIDPSINNGFASHVTASRSGSRFLISWISDHDPLRRLQGAVIEHDGTVLTPNGISVPQQGSTTYPVSVPASAGGWAMAHVQNDENGNTVRLALLDSGGATTQVKNLIGPWSIYGPVRLAADFGTFVAAWKGFYIPATNVISVLYVDENYIPETVVPITVSGAVNNIAVAVANGSVLVAYSRTDSSGVHLCYRLLTPSGTEIVVSAEHAVPLAGSLYGAPSEIQAFGNSSGEYSLVWLEGSTTTNSAHTATISSSGTLSSPTTIVSGSPAIYGLFTATGTQSRLISWSVVGPQRVGLMRGVTANFSGSIFNEFGLPGISMSSDTRGAATAGAVDTTVANEWLFAYREADQSTSFYGDRIVARFARTDHVDPDDQDLDGVTLAQGDCSDVNPNVWASCGACRDVDQDGYWVGCDAYATIAGPDCDDTRAQCTYDCAEEDRDGDGLARVPACGTGADCNDDDPTVYSGAPELCDDIDNDCDGLIDEENAVDADGDGYFDYCQGAPTGALVDCDELDAARHPNAQEVCDYKDNDCDGLVDEDDSSCQVVLAGCDGDADGDGHVAVGQSCAGVTGDDCDDSNAAIHPGASDPCGGVDSDCAPDVDADGDGHYASGCSTADDCDDEDASAWDVCVTAARLTTYQYDALGRMVSQQTTSGAEVVGTTYHYGNFTGSPAVPGAFCVSTGQAFNPDLTLSAGRLTWVEHGAGITYYGYDGSGEIAAVFLQRDRAVFDVCALEVVRYSHDGLGRITSVTYPSRRQARYTYGGASLRPLSITLFDASGTSMGALMQDAVYDVDQALVDYVAGAVRFLGSVDKGGAMTRRRYAAGSTALFDWTSDVDGDGVDALERDGSGNYLQLADLASATSFAFGYDGQERLTSVTSSLATSAMNCTYSYDAAGNRTAHTCADDAATYNYIAGSNRPRDTTYTAVDGDCTAGVSATVNGTTNRFGEVTRYAKNGCPGDVHTIDYNATGSVVGFDGNPQTRVTYDERNLARTMGVNRKLAYDLAGRVLSDADGDVITEYVWMGAYLIAVIASTPPGPTTVHAVGTDDLGAPWRAWTGLTAATSWSVAYAPFGATTPEDGATSYSPTPAIAVRRPGQLSDASSAISQNRFRVYDSWTGRYSSQDPLARAVPGWRQPAYAYASNNPLYFVDPSGLEIIPQDSATYAALTRIYADPYLGPVIDQIERSPVDVYAQRGGDTPGNTVGPFQDGSRKYDLVAYNPDAGTSMPAWDDVLLAHELGHVLDDINGVKREEELPISAENYLRYPGPYRPLDRNTCDYE